MGSNIEVLKKLSPAAIGTVVVAGHLLTNALAVSAGMSHSLALTSDGTVMGWGGNSSGESTGNKTPWPSRANGLVKIEGKTLCDVVGVAAGRTHSLALKRDGTVIIWGDNYFGQMIPKGLSNAIAIAAGENGNLALKSDGTVFSWGYAKQPPPATLKQVISIAATTSDSGHDLALKSDGAVVEWLVHGMSDSMVSPEGLNHVVSIAAGDNHYLALKNDGTVYGWGFNSKGQATGVPSQQGRGLVTIDGKLLTDAIAIAAGTDFSLALKMDGTVVLWGDDFRHYLDPPMGLTNVVAIAVGQDFCLAITTNSAVANRFRH